MNSNKRLTCMFKTTGIQADVSAIILDICPVFLLYIYRHASGLYKFLLKVIFSYKITVSWCVLQLSHQLVPKLQNWLSQ